MPDYRFIATGATEFTHLTDTPNSYSGQGGKFVRVKSTEDGLEFATPQWSDIGARPWEYNGAHIYNTNTGNVGVGTNLPSAKLHVVGDIALSGGTRFIGTVDNNSLQIRTNNTSRLVVTNDGKVGIGVTSPTTTLDVGGTIKGVSYQTVFPSFSIWNNQWSDVTFDLTNGTTSTGVVFEFDFKVSTVDFRFRFGLDDNNHYFVSWEANNGFTIRKVVGGATTTLASTTFTWVANTEGAHGIVRITNNTIYWTVTRPDGTVSSTISAAVDTTNLPLGSNYKISFVGADRVYNFTFLNGQKRTVSGKDIYIDHNTGNVGIGTTSPTTKLQVVGNIGLSGADRSVGTVDNYKLRLMTNNTTRVTVDTAGNVGIGTDSPSTTLHVVGNIGLSGAARNVGTIDNYNLNLVTNNTVRVTIDTSGRVGIGVTSPTTTLQVAGNIGVSGAVRNIGSVDNYALNFMTNNTTRMTIDTSGRVGIGTTSPGATLHVFGTGVDTVIGNTGSGYSTLRLLGSNTDGYAYIQAGISAADTAAKLRISRYTTSTTNIQRMEVYSDTVYISGKVGIGNTSPSSTLHVNGPIATPVATVTTSTTLGDTHSTVLVNASSGNINIWLPSAASAPGRIYVIKKIDNTSNTVTILPAGTETIDGQTSLTINQPGGAVVLQSDGSSNWRNWVVTTGGTGSSFVSMSTGGAVSITAYGTYVLGGIYVPTGKNLYIVAVSGIAWTVSYGDSYNPQSCGIELYDTNIADTVTSWTFNTSTTYIEVNSTYNYLQGRILLFRLYNPNAVTVNAWGSVSFRLVSA